MSNPSNIVSILDPQIPVDQSIYESSSTRKAKLGTRLVVGDRVFRYAKVLGTGAEAGEVLCCPIATASHASGILTVSAATTGAATVHCTASVAVAAGVYDEGYLAISSTGLAGGGLMLRVKKQSASAAAASAFAIELYDAIPTAIGAGWASLVPCLYNGVARGTTLTSLAAGVSQVVVSSGYYGWIQTWGPAAVKMSAGHAAGLILYVGASGGAAGVVAIAELTAGGMAIGKNMNLAATGSYAEPCYLTIAP